MRTKTLLLTAAVAAAGVASTMAQVYSVNTVGYVNVVAKGGGLTLLANPLDDGTNTLSTILAALPNKSAVQTWTGAGFTGASKVAGVWTPNPAIAVGQGFFVSLPAGADVTNTFVGTVVPNSGSSVTSSLPAGFSLVGTILPVSGALSDPNAPGALNLGASLPNKSSIQSWNNAVTPNVYIGSSKVAGTWTPNQTINPGQGFFVNTPAGGATWVQSLP
jgi:hypothetical protein